MAESPLSQQLLHFFVTHVQSIERLEILCLLAENPSKSWSISEVFRCIQSTEKSVAEGLQHFVKHDLASTNDEQNFRFPAKSSDTTMAAIQLVKIYRERRVAVIEAIYKRPTDAIQSFADAFRLRKDK